MKKPITQAEIDSVLDYIRANPDCVISDFPRGSRKNRALMRAFALGRVQQVPKAPNSTRFRFEVLPVRFA